MNRRDLLKAAAGALAGAGIAGEVEAIDAEPRPLLLVLRLERPCPSDRAAAIRYMLEKLLRGTPHPPIVILQPGMTLEAVADPRRPQPENAMLTRPEAERRGG